MSRNVRKMLTLGTALAIVSSVATVDASSIVKQLDAYYYNIKVNLNGQNKNVSNEPFMYNNSVYVGLRDFSEITGYDVAWDSANKTVKITGGDSDELQELKLDNAMLEAENAALKAKISQYEQAAEDAEDEEDDEDDDSTSITGITTSDIRYMIEDLEDDYEDEYDVSWEYDIEIDDESIIFNVYYNSRYDEDAFNEISVDEMDKYLEDMSDDIQHELGDYEIIGIVSDEYEEEDVYSFDMSDTGRFNLEPINSKASLRRFEDYLNDEYTELPEIAHGTLDGLVIDIDEWELDEDHDFEEITFDIYTDLSSTYEEAWNDLSTSDVSEVEDLLDDIADEIEDQFNAEEISGYIWNTYEKLILKYEDGRVTLVDFRD